MATLAQARKLVHQLVMPSKIKLLSELEDEVMATNPILIQELENARAEIRRGDTATLEEALNVLQGNQ